DVYPALRQLAPEGVPQPHLRFVKDGKLTYAGGISSGIDASFAVLADIAGDAVCEATAKYMEYFRNPADCGNLSPRPSLEFLIDDTECRINRPKDKTDRKRYDSGKQQAHSVKHLAIHDLRGKCAI
ncbi:MAG: hypothetical protein AAGF66_20115, partial [Cyanobacteria bacterium P01_H01_bin.119]